MILFAARAKFHNLIAGTIDELNLLRGPCCPARLLVKEAIAHETNFSTNLRT
jgi:hypothetical protein